jgi:Family of unknown function (DUF6502)
LRHEKQARHKKLNTAGAQSGAKAALQKLMEPLAGFACDCGLSVNEVILLLREGAVRSAARRQCQGGRRINISGIAATTGISRAEASRTLRQSYSAAGRMGDRHLSPTNRILKAWHCDPKFLTAKQEPAELKLFGRGLTFESLASKYGRGLPVRAIFDELTRIGAIELRASKGIVPKISVAVDRRITPQMIEVFSSGVADLLSVVSRAPHRGVKKSLTVRSPRRRNLRRGVD